MRRFLSVLVLVSLTACIKSDGTGPTGPEGPQGPPGVTGATRLTFYGSADGSGSAVADLPEEAGTMTNPPIFACYLEYTVSSASFWEQTGTTGSAQNAACVLGLTPSGSALRVSVDGAAVGQLTAIVVIY